MIIASKGGNIMNEDNNNNFILVDEDKLKEKKWKKIVKILLVVAIICSFVMNGYVFYNMMSSCLLYTSYLYNRTDQIANVAYKISSTVPNAKVAIGHGQMDKNELEDVMLRFMNKEFNVLICTTIIETGIDIPNANTMIVEDADKFGLAQLLSLIHILSHTFVE